MRVTMLVGEVHVIAFVGEMRVTMRVTVRVTARVTVRDSKMHVTVRVVQVAHLSHRIPTTSAQQDKFFTSYDND